MPDISMKQICNLATMIGALIALILGVLILSKINKNGWCSGSEGYKKQSKKILKATNACAYIPDQNNNQYPCGQWASQNALNNGMCTSQDGGTVMPCTGQDDDYGPLDCCQQLCPDVVDFCAKNPSKCQEPNPQYTCLDGQ